MHGYHDASSRGQPSEGHRGSPQAKLYRQGSQADRASKTAPRASPRGKSPGPSTETPPITQTLEFTERITTLEAASATLQAKLSDVEEKHERLLATVNEQATELNELKAKVEVSSGEANKRKRGDESIGL